jgi:hypothetical protein
MSGLSNPFLRGYTQLNIDRRLLVTSDEDMRLHYRSVHPLQAHIPDSQLECTFCHYGDAFALVPERQTLPDELVAQCSHTGFVLKALHAVTGQQSDVLFDIGDAHSGELAKEVVRQLKFDTGHYSRCWEISTRHLLPAELHWLERCADNALPHDLLFQAFSAPSGPGAIGILLNDTPWTDRHLHEAFGFDTTYLRRSHELAEMPLNLIDILHLAAAADSRIVIFDPGAQALSGLPLVD